jgi:hypothetical protein
MARGPAYPYVGLQQAVELSKKLYSFAKRTPVLPDTAIKEAWEYSPTSSSGQKVLAALRYFGLVEDVQAGEGKQIRLSDRAYRILLDSPDSPDRKRALRDALLAPKAYAYCWKRWDGEMPPAMRSHLIFDQGFNEGTVDSFLRDYKASVEFAGFSGENAQGHMAEDQANGDGQNTKSGDIDEPSITPIAKLDSVAKQTTSRGSAGTWIEVFNLPEGAVTIQIPASLSAESFEDLIAGLEILKRKIGRMVAKADPERAEVTREPKNEG